MNTFNNGAQEVVKIYQLSLCVVVGPWTWYLIIFATTYCTIKACSPMQMITTSCESGATIHVTNGLIVHNSHQLPRLVPLSIMICLETWPIEMVEFFLGEKVLGKFVHLGGLNVLSTQHQFLYNNHE